MEIQLTLTEEELDCLTIALEQRLENVNMRLSEKGGSKDYYDYFEQEKKLILGIFSKIEAAQ